MNQETIIENHLSICYNCAHARKPASEENEKASYVGCSYFAKVENYSDIKILSTITEAKEVSEGWVDLRAKVFGEKSGIISNFQILTKEVKKCNQYDFR